jgi:hypothetical protein
MVRFVDQRAAKLFLAGKTHFLLRAAAGMVRFVDRTGGQALPAGRP